MLPRALTATIQASAATFPVITLTGPRQSGKTTLSRAAFPDHDYVSLEAVDDRAHALEDPRDFLARFEGPVILDEVQRAPDLFSYIQGIVDEQATAGRYVLTGSQNFLVLEKVSQSLAGRCAVHHLLPFSLAEREGWSVEPVDSIGSRPTRRDPPPDGLLDSLCRGFYPAIHDKGHDASTWLASYYQTYLERDVRELVNVGDIESFGRFVRLCAGRSGQILDVQRLGADCGISRTTAQRWLSVLEASFLVHLLRPHHRNFAKRLVKRPKLYLLDTGLLCFLLGIRSAEDLRTHASRGPVFESFVLSELIKGHVHAGRMADVWYWRSSDGHEVDFLLDHGGTFTAIEAKSGTTVGSDFFDGLDYWRKLAKDDAGSTALVYGGDESHRRRDSVLLPWFAL